MLKVDITLFIEGSIPQSTVWINTACNAPATKMDAPINLAKSVRL